jgi:hypothetical protein
MAAVVCFQLYFRIFIFFNFIHIHALAIVDIGQFIPLILRLGARLKWPITFFARFIRRFCLQKYNSFVDMKEGV